MKSVLPRRVRVVSWATLVLVPLSYVLLSMMMTLIGGGVLAFIIPMIPIMALVFLVWGVINAFRYFPNPGRTTMDTVLLTIPVAYAIMLAVLIGLFMI